MANKKQYKRAIEISNGTETNISYILDNTPGAVHNYRKNNPDIDQLIKDKRNELIDRAENVGSELLDYEDDENPTQAAGIRMKESQYVRSRLGKNKGWTERTEIEHSGESISIQVNIPNEVKELLK